MGSKPPCVEADIGQFEETEGGEGRFSQLTVEGPLEADSLLVNGETETNTFKLTTPVYQSFPIPADRINPSGGLDQAGRENNVALYPGTLFFRDSNTRQDSCFAQQDFPLEGNVIMSNYDIVMTWMPFDNGSGITEWKLRTRCADPNGIYQPYTETAIQINVAGGLEDTGVHTVLLSGFVHNNNYPCWLLLYRDGPAEPPNGAGGYADSIRLLGLTMVRTATTLGNTDPWP